MGMRMEEDWPETKAIRLAFLASFISRFIVQGEHAATNGKSIVQTERRRWQVKYFI